MRAGYYLRLLWDMARVRLAEMREYSADFAVLLITVPSYLLVNLFFWQVIFSHARVIAGWTLGEVILLQAFMNLGFLFWNLLYIFPEELDEIIVSGELNTVLSKPVNPVIYLLVTNIDVLGALKNLSGVVAYFLVAGWLGADISLPGLLAGVLMVFLGVTIASTIVFLIQSLSFWFGRTNALNLFYNAYFTVSEYPVTIFPASVKFVLVMFLPVVFFTTGPALSSLKEFPPEGVLGLIALSLLVWTVWLLSAWLLWKAGLKRYEAYGS